MGLVTSLMAIEGFNLIKMLSSPFTGLYCVKFTMVGLGIGMLCFIGFGMYKAYIKKPDATTSQRAESIVNHYHNPRSTFGCATTRTYVDYPVNAVR